MQTTVKQRLVAFIKEKGLSQRKFEATVGVSNGFVNNISKGIGADKMQKILSVFPDLNTSWLLTGEGTMLRTDASAAAGGEATKSAGIPLIPIEAMAGALTGEVTVMDYECERFVVPKFKGADFLITVGGVSMQPTYCAGDVVGCRRVPLTDIFFQWGRVYVIDTNQGALLKRIKPASHPENILLVSDNKDYDPFEIPREAIHGVALVVGLIREE